MTDSIKEDQGGFLCLQTSPTTLASLLGGLGILSVPPFQRAYAWKDRQVDAFLSDIDRCRCARQSGESLPHFFGAIVSCISAPRPGITRPHNILIDGQQRLATLYMFIVLLRQQFEEAKLSARANGNMEIGEVFKTRESNLRDGFEVAKDTEFSEPKFIRKLRLCEADDDFFGAMISGDSCKVERASHGRLQDAFDTIGRYFEDCLERAVDSDQRLRVLDSLYNAFIKDWSVVHLSTDDRRHANLLFRVLNTRGVRITEGELLRAKTIEAASSQLEASDLSTMSDAWDEMLGGEVFEADEALEIIYQSRTGRRSSENRIDSDYESEFFPELLETQNLTDQEARNLHSSVRTLRDKMSTLSRLGSGLPPFDESKMDAVSRSRFKALITILDQRYCLPFMLAASSLDPKRFKELSDIVERFIFRYSIMVGAPIKEADSLFREHAAMLRDDPDSYKPQILIQSLRLLIDQYADDGKFKQGLSSLKYGQGANYKIRYLLIMLEHMFRWWSNNPQGRPVCRDLTRVLDFSDMTIEHICPRNPDSTELVLARYIDTIGNLTILSDKENSALGNKPYADKKQGLANSTYDLNKEIVKNETWSVDTIEERTKRLIEISLKVFSL